MTTQKFKKLLKQIYRGDTQALGYIYEEYYDKMVYSAKLILGNKQDAEDAAANVILKILNMALQNETVKIKNVGSYLYASVKNAAIKIYNKRKNLVSDSVIAEVSATNSDLNRLLERYSIEHALEELNDCDRNIAMLFYFYDYKIREIASELNIPEGTIKWKLNNIRKKFEKFLN